ncbi:hypothetical protein FE257_003252 [Aspergillus nanangensis]|uniref:Transcription factor domain-containing protein n=1 Tax=Aspergillus nanangensis TaxID=2582783 RepID=A0AAD4CSI4_ASPNN|nr:hypothetical protein FE257_003252 [Aspergillus nanangensis]
MHLVNGRNIFTEYLLVMAMAKLMDVENPSQRPPGANLFAEGMRPLSALHQMGEEGIIGIKILTLILTYLQWCDRKHDAYLHIGLPLRLAIALGCDKPANRQSCLPSQAALRVRLWRLSSGLGLAAGADERQLRTELRQRTIGFQFPIPLSINVRIARITDDIMSSLYGNASIKQIDLIRKIQKYGFFDLDTTFSAAFVLVMMSFVDKRQDRPPTALDQAFEILQFLADTGNFAADRRLQDIRHSWRRVWCHYPRAEQQLASEQLQSPSAGLSLNCSLTALILVSSDLGMKLAQRSKNINIVDF